MARTTQKQRLVDYITNHGPIKTARISMTQAGLNYKRVGTARYEVRLNRKGEPANVAVKAPTGGWWDEAAAQDELLAICSREDRLELAARGSLTPKDIKEVIAHLGLR